MKKNTALLLCTLALSGCIFKSAPKKSEPTPTPAQPAITQPVTQPDISFGADADVANSTAADAAGSTYSNKKFGFELWHPDNMGVTENNDGDSTIITIDPANLAQSNLSIHILAERNPKTTFANLEGKFTVLNDTFMKRVPVDAKDAQKTNVYIFEKNNTRVTISLAPGTSPANLTFPDIIQSFKFTN